MKLRDQLNFVYADAADPATGVVASWAYSGAHLHGTCARIDGPAWVIDRDNATEPADLIADSDVAGIILPRIVLVTRRPVRLV